MQVKAMTTFNSRRGMVHAGDLIDVDPAYARDLSRRRPPWVEILAEADVEPPRRQAIAQAPLTQAEPITEESMRPATPRTIRTVKK